MDEQVVPVICKNSCRRRDCFSLDDEEPCFIGDGSPSEFDHDQYADRVYLTYDAQIIIFVIAGCVTVTVTGVFVEAYWRPVN